MGDDILVHCAFDKMVAIHELKPNPLNPNFHPREQIERLAEIIKKTGWRCPITVSNVSGLIVKGHGRLMAAELLGCKVVPVDFQDYENESLELADLMADNSIAELSVMDDKKLLNLFEEFDTGAVEFSLSGYDEEFYKKLAHSFDEYDVEKKKVKTIKCPHCGLEIEV